MRAVIFIEIIEPRADRNHQGDPQEQHAEGMKINPQIFVMEHQPADGERLNEGLSLSPVVGRDDDSLRRGDRPETGDRDLAGHDDDDHPRVNTSQRDQHDQRRIDEQFIRQRIQQLSDRGFAFLLAGDISVQEVRCGGDAEEKGRQEASHRAGEKKKNHDHRNRPDAQERDRIGNIPDDRPAISFSGDLNGSFHRNLQKFNRWLLAEKV